MYSELPGKCMDQMLFISPNVKFRHLMKNIFQSLKIGMEDVMVITWNIRLILLKHQMWW